MTFFTLFSCVSIKNIVHLFGSALLERRIILVAENLSTLSSCVMAASNLLQPFHWQHVYIPVLPLVLMDYCFAEDSQILTDAGFLSLDEYSLRRDSLLVAGYDERTGQRVFERSSRMIVNPWALQDMIEFTGANGSVSLLVTPEHDMYVRRGSGYCKQQAGSLVGARNFEMVASAAQSGGRALRLSEEELVECGRRVASEGRMPACMWELDQRQLCCVFPEGRVLANNEMLRDELLALFTRAGCWASCSGDVVCFGVGTVFVESVRRVRYAGRTWCVTLPCGLVWARRVSSSAVSAAVVCGNCTAPMPFFVGVLKSCLPLLETMPLEEVLVLDIENDRFLKDPGFEEALPAPEMKKLVKTLKAINPTPERDSDLQIASCFYQFFYDIFAGYEHFYDLKDLPPAKNAAPGAPVQQGYRFDKGRFAATKAPHIRQFLDQFGESQVLQTFLQESEPVERRYRFVNQQEYIQHLAVSRDLEMADAVRNVGRALGNAWSAAKKRLENKKLDQAGNPRRDDISSPTLVPVAAPIRVPDSENIDIILAREMTAKRLAAQQHQQQHQQQGGDITSSPSFNRKQTHRVCTSCNMYIDIGMNACPHCQRPQMPVVVQLEPIKPALMLDERHKRPPPPPPPKRTASVVAASSPGASKSKKVPPPPPAPPKKPLSRDSAGPSSLPDISTLHLTLTSVFEEEDGGGAPLSDVEDDQTGQKDAPPQTQQEESSESPPPAEEAPQREEAELLHAPAARVAVAKAARKWVAPPPSHQATEALDEAKTPILDVRRQQLGNSSGALMAAKSPPPKPASASKPFSDDEEEPSASRTSRTPLQPRRPAPPPPPLEQLSPASPAPAPKAKGGSRLAARASTRCVTCGEVECSCAKQEGGVAVTGGGVRICVHCGSRSDRSDAKFCVTCGKTLVAPSPSSAAAARPWVAKKPGSQLAVAAQSEQLPRGSYKKRHCGSCGEDSETNGAQCPLCQAWF